MECLSPLLATDYGYFTDGSASSKLGKRAVFVKPLDLDNIIRLNKLDPNKYYPIPCGKCFACKSNRRLQWSLRLQCEQWTNPICSFITLTYNDEHLPSGSPSKYDVQCFIKRLRNIPRDLHVSVDGFKYFICLEFGSTTRRPHYHGIVFGLDFLNPFFDPYLATTKDGHPIYSSRTLERIWQQGYVTVDSVSPAVLNYVTKYVLKTIDDKDCWFVFSRNIGRSLFTSNGSLNSFALDVLKTGVMTFGDFQHSFVSAPPRFLMRILRGEQPDLYAALKQRSKCYLQSAKTDSRSAADRVVGSLERHKKENMKRILDNA